MRRVALNIAIDVDDDKAAGVIAACEDGIRGLRAMDGVTEVSGTLSDDTGRARAAHEIVDAKTAKAQAKADAKAGDTKT